MNAARGAIVVIVALVIGVVVLARGLNEPGTANEPLETTTTAPSPPPADSPTTQAPAVDTTIVVDTTAAALPPPPPAGETDLPPDAPDDLFVEAVPPPPTHNRSEVRVLVANGTSLCGAAGRLATSLSARGFNVLPPTNADNPADASAVYYVEGYGADGAVLASLLQVDSSRVLPMPSSPPTAPGDAHVLLHIGADELAQPNC